MGNGFTDADEVVEALREQDYVPDAELAVVVLLATRLGKPLLLEGPAGVGKTELAKALAAAGGRRLVRLQCYEGIDEGRALYEWDYGKQLMHVQMLRERIGEALADAPDLAAAAEMLQRQDTGLYTEHFLATRPLMEAILSPEPVLLLVDEVDRADEALEALLLEVLAEQQVTVPEIGTFTARSSPWVVLTSNDTRELTPALKRRCLHFPIDFPTAERESEIVQRRVPGIKDEALGTLVELAGRLRELPLRKPPSISEVVDAARAAEMLGDTWFEDEAWLTSLVKYVGDRDVARGELAAREPAAAEPAGTTAGPAAAFRGHGGRDHDRGSQHGHRSRR
ncbi:dynein-related subfamily AAA family protein [Saccharopolyspora erythraea NRRL 2338]|uniref:Possible ATP-dependent protease n=2 Tax=Saccharopolyspora erythraea TaxID=1836 RepID=A4FCB0_SACEN|nr:MoxR family ATPase [Saccharopolyspora erythraea]EQD84991.1 ATPase AAA [Saccharopolyspora erythraea D]PFG95446.1 dynein-related subfamily AAA family protein [Saccharopolyspora erythraea NRRL 2338]QRK92080.1 MoxR family ATPase [Saccharopolyspora erythraea]CAM01685.1 possible ATP-dependent protease [Saccharopolyspora erythraea NRRL 2338]